MKPYCLGKHPFFPRLCGNIPSSIFAEAYGRKALLVGGLMSIGTGDLAALAAQGPRGGTVGSGWNGEVPGTPGFFSPGNDGKSSGYSLWKFEKFEQSHGKFG